MRNVEGATAKRRSDLLHQPELTEGRLVKSMRARDQSRDSADCNQQHWQQVQC